MAAEAVSCGRAVAGFRAMGADAELLVIADDDRAAARLLGAACDRVEALEARWSRFRPHSEVSRLNTLAGLPVDVSWETALLVERAIEAWRSTGGGFDPSVLAAMVAAGYDRDFAELDLSPSRAWHTELPALHAACTDIVVDGCTVLLPEGLGFDPGGIGKGLAADLVAAETMAAGAIGVCVNLGGDVRAMGDPEPALRPARPWVVDVEAPGSDEPIAQVRVTNGAVATSTSLLRRWRVGSSVRHHLIDPATGRPSDSDVVLVSVAGPQAWDAETLAKASLLRGSARVFDLIDGDHWALAVTDDGRTLTTTGGGW